VADRRRGAPSQAQPHHLTVLLTTSVALDPSALYNAVLVAVVLTIAVSATLVRLGHRQAAVAAT